MRLAVLALVLTACGPQSTASPDGASADPTNADTMADVTDIADAADLADTSGTSDTGSALDTADTTRGA